MIKNKKILSLLFSSCLSLSAIQSKAEGIPTFDISNYTQQLQQLKEAVKQYEQAKKLYDAGHGVRAIAQGIDTTYDIGVDFVEHDNDFLQEKIGINYDGLSDKTKEIYSLQNDSVFRNQNLSSKTLSQSIDRLQKMTRFGERLLGATDMKDVMDLQARSGAESNMLQNELVKVNAIRLKNEADKELLEQMKLQMLLDVVGDSTSNFNYNQ